MIACNVAVVPIQGICYWMIFGDLGGEVDDNVHMSMTNLLGKKDYR